MKRILKFRISRILSYCLPVLAALVPTLSNAQLVPAISRFNPISGTVGTSVNIAGTNFNPASSSNIVFFGAVQATVAAASATNLTITVPAGSSYAPITVMVNGLTAWSGQPFLPRFMGNGQIDTGTLAARVDLPSINGVGVTIIADLDGDGKADVVVCCGNHLVSIYRNISTNGSLTAGAFAPRVDLSLGSGGDSFTVADVDGDGKPDLLFADSSANQVAVLRNLCSPGNITTNSFASRVNFSVGSGPRNIAVRDLDGDGKPEIATANWGDSTVSVLRNIGSAGDISTNSFAPAVNFAVGPGPQTLAIADLDGDGAADVVTANINAGSSQSVSVLRNISTLGSIAFTPEVDLPGLPTSFCVAIGDLDGDGKLDLVVSSFNNGQAVSVYQNVSTRGSLTTSSFAPRVDFNVGGWGNAVAIGDLDGDGKPDLAVVTQLPDHLSLFKNTSTPGSLTTSSFAARVDYSAGYNPNGIAIGDLDGDGRADIVFANTYDSTISIYQNQTPPGLPPIFSSQPQSSTNAVGSTVMLAADVKGATPISYQWLFHGVPLTDNGRISGSTNSTLILSNLQTNDIGDYQLLATNFLGSTNSSMAFLDVVYVLVPPTITQQPTNQNVVTGSNIVLSVVVAGDIPLYCQWYLNGTALADNGRISGSASTSLTVSNSQPADAGNYNIIITNWAGSVTSATAVVTILVPPTILIQPVGRSVPPGLPTTIAALFVGDSLSYQWQLNGVDIPGATNTSYSIAAVGTNDLGFYHLVASNSLNLAVSADAQLTFGPVAAWGANSSNEALPPPGLTNVFAVAGSSGASFALRTDGSIAAWGNGLASNIPFNATNVVALSSFGTTANDALRSDGTVVSWSGLGAPVLSNIVSVAAGNNFGYALRAEGTLISWGAVPTPVFPSGLNHLTAIACGYNNALAERNDGTLVASGSGAVTNIPPGLNNVAAIAVGYTYAMALKTDGTVVTWGSGTATNLPAGMTNIVGISAGNTSGENFGVAIRADGAVLTWGDNSSGETVPPAALGNLVSIAGAAAAFHGLALVSDGRPVILHPPIGLTTYTGRDVILHGDAAGAQPLSYQWQLNGTNLPGATNASLVISNLQFGNAGNYQLFVSNAVNTAMSLLAPLTVISNNTLTILGGPGSQAVYQGGQASLSVAVSGVGPLRYQWFFSPTNAGVPANYTAVPGATNDTLRLDPALAVQSGNYYVVVSNQASSIISPPANLRVMFAKTWGYLATDPPFTVTNATAVAVGNAGSGGIQGHYLALRSDGKISSWANSFIYFGETNVSALSNAIVTAVAAGYEDSLALKSDGTVYAWGYSPYGETNPPSGLNSVVAIACGDYHDLALKSDGTMTGWGQNIYFQTTNAAATNVVAIAAGGLDSMALRADGTVVSWGSFNTPAPFNATNVIAIACGGAHYLALRANGTVVGWGNNPYGQIAIPANATNIVSVSAGANHSILLRNDGTVVTLGAYAGSTVITAPADLTNVIAVACGGDHDLALFGTRAPAFTIQPWNRTVIFNTTTNITLAAKCAGVQPVRYQWQLNGTNLPAATNDTLILTNQPFPTAQIRLIQPGAYQLVASNAYGIAISKPAKLTVIVPLSVALNTPTDGKGNALYSWITSGNAQWFGETNVTHDGVAAAQSGGIGALQETILQTTLVTNWSGRCTFWWKVSSEQYFDFLEFRVNGTIQTNISGEVNWQPVSIPVATGTNVLMWRYSKDASVDAGQDAGWVDQFGFVPDGPIITVQPVSQTVNLGATVQFHVTAIGPTNIFPNILGYQWRKDGSLIGGNSPFLVLNNVGRAQDGTYFVTVTNINLPNNSTVSSNAMLKVLVPQLLGTPVLLSDGTLVFTSTDANGGLLSPSDLPNFEAQASTNLVDWVTLPNALSLTNGMLELQDNTRTNWPTRFYRLLEH